MSGLCPLGCVPVSMFYFRCASLGSMGTNLYLHCAGARGSLGNRNCPIRGRNIPAKRSRLTYFQFSEFS